MYDAAADHNRISLLSTSRSYGCIRSVLFWVNATSQLAADVVVVFLLRTIVSVASGQFKSIIGRNLERIENRSIGLCGSIVGYDP